MTKKCVRTIGKLPVERDRLMSLVITGTRIEAQSLRREAGDRIKFALLNCCEENLRGGTLLLRRRERELGAMSGGGRGMVERKEESAGRGKGVYLEKIVL